MDFYDAAHYENIPSGAHACVYSDGLYACPPEQTVRFKATRWITVLGGADAAKYAGILDYEARQRVVRGRRAARVGGGAGRDEVPGPRLL